MVWPQTPVFKIACNERWLETDLSKANLTRSFRQQFRDVRKRPSPFNQTFIMCVLGLRLGSVVGLRLGSVLLNPDIRGYDGWACIGNQLR